MSTRCNLLLTEDTSDHDRAHPDTPCRPREIWLYHHSDGYVTGMGTELVGLMEWMCGNKHQFIDSAVLATVLVKGAVKPHIYGQSRTAPVDDGWEVTSGQHGDIEWLYTITDHWTADGRAIDSITLRAEHLASGIAHDLCRIRMVHGGIMPEYESERLTLCGEMEDEVDGYYNRD